MKNWKLAVIGAVVVGGLAILGTGLAFAQATGNRGTPTGNNTWQVGPPSTPTPTANGNHCGGNEPTMREWMDTTHGAGSFDAMDEYMDKVMGEGWFEQMHGSNSGTGSMMGGSGMTATGSGGMMGGGGMTGNGSGAQGMMGDSSMMGAWK